MGIEKKLGIDHIYVVHPPFGYEWHEQRLQKILGEKLGFDYEFFEQNGIVLNETEYSRMIAQYFTPDIREILPTGILDCTLRHILFYERMIERGDRFALILENDPCPMRNFPDMLAKITTEAENLPAGIFISLENTTLKFPRRKDVRRGQYLYKADFGRCAGAYILDFAAAQNIVNHLQKHRCNKVIDHWHNDMAGAGVFSIYWAHPSCVEQGSHNGRTQRGAISTKRAGILRRISWLLQKFYKQYLLRII
ncbi:MAG: hypothetical protein LBH32_02385 [Dysgonamonadaceae bacterium]|jgi:hypothetical protein|nr:hypothetical protein [Dysgonamonadaceae bacterium]